MLQNVLFQNIFSHIIMLTDFIIYYIIHLYINMFLAHIPPIYFVMIFFSISPHILNGHLSDL